MERREHLLLKILVFFEPLYFEANLQRLVHVDWTSVRLVFPRARQPIGNLVTLPLRLRERGKHVHIEPLRNFGPRKL